MNDRVKILIARELDGTLSDLERAELDRKILVVPDARRDRAAWKKVIGALKEDQPPKKLAMDRMAAEIVARANRGPVVPLSRMRRAVLGATLAAAGFTLVALVRPPERPVVIEQVAVVSDTATAPVELSIDEDGEEEVATITTIRF